MIGGTLSALVLVAIALAFVVSPLLRRDAARSERRAESLGELRELHAKQQMLLNSLRDLEDDRATNKLSDADYDSLKSRISAEAIEVMRQLDVLQASHEEAREQERKAAQPLRYPDGGRETGPIS